MKLTIVIDVEGSVDPALVDPHEIAEDIVDWYMEERPHRVPVPPFVRVVAAEWRDALDGS